MSTTVSADRPMPVVPAASDPHGPVIVKYTVLASYLVTFIIGLHVPRGNRDHVSKPTTETDYRNRPNTVMRPTRAFQLHATRSSSSPLDATQRRDVTVATTTTTQTIHRNR